MNLGKLWTEAKDHVQFILVVIVIIAIILAVAILAEKMLFKGQDRKRFKNEKYCRHRYAFGNFHGADVI